MLLTMLLASTLTSLNVTQNKNKTRNKGKSLVASRSHPKTIHLLNVTEDKILNMTLTDGVYMYEGECV